ncbi:MAG: GNAT family N-acetyltransferase [Myxococcota bacterium]
MPDLDEYLAKITRAADDLSLRQNPSPYAIALTDSIAHVREHDWDSVVGPHRVFLGRRYLAAVERAKPPRMSFRYAVIYDGPNAVAVAAYQVMAVALDAFSSRAPVAKPDDASLRSTLREVRRNVVRTVGDALGDTGAQRLLIGGNGLVTGEHGFAVADGADPTLAVQGLADATYRIRRAEKLRGAVASVLIKDFHDRSRPHADELLRFGYHAFAVDPNMSVVLPATWRSFDDYLAAMTAKYRRKVKDARKKAKALHATRLTRDEIEANAGVLYRLYQAVHDKAKFRLANPGPDYFPSMAAALGDDFVVRAYRLDDAIVGCSIAIGGPTELEAHMVGLDYEHNVPHGVYQNALYDFIEDGLSRGATQVSMGRTALEIKSSIGATPQPVTCYMRHSNPLGNRLIAPLVAQIAPDEWAPRSPFKESEAPAGEAGPPTSGGD